MSRSYKKHPIVKDHCKGMKEIANRHLRRKGLEEIPNNKGYKRLFNSYNISDFKFSDTFQEYLRSRERRYNRTDFTQEEIIKFKDEWERVYKRK